MNNLNLKIKKVIADYLLKDLMPVEIIYYKDSVWFIDRERKYWYFEYHKTDKHLWWRWSHFQTALKIFSLNGEENQSIFGEIVSSILNKKQILECKYPNKVFKTVGSILNFKEEVKEVLNLEVKKTLSGGSRKNIEAHKVVEEALNHEVETTSGFQRMLQTEVEEALNHNVETTSAQIVIKEGRVEEVLNHNVETTSMNKVMEPFEVEQVLNCEVETTAPGTMVHYQWVEKVLNCEVETTAFHPFNNYGAVEEVLNCEVETTRPLESIDSNRVERVLNNQVETTQWEDLPLNKMVEELLNHEIETADWSYMPKNSMTEEVLNHEVETTKHLAFDLYTQVEDILNHEVETIGEAYHNDDYVTEEILNNTINTYRSGELVDEEKFINNVLNYGTSEIEIKTVEKLRGENPFQDVVVSHILDESDKVTDKLKIAEDDNMTYGHDVFMCEHLVQNVLEIGSNSISFDTTSQQGRVNGVLKNS